MVVVAVERERRQLRFSEKATEGEGQELAQKKAQLMVSSRCRLSVPLYYVYWKKYKKCTSKLVTATKLLNSSLDPFLACSII